MLQCMRSGGQNHPDRYAHYGSALHLGDRGHCRRSVSVEEMMRGLILPQDWIIRLETWGKLSFDA
ncbi:hypothetical protein ACERZ8_20340 [Tateyamaria armeniaca]|uniref:Uncharacterized protein n=1 Tax=Tateyamaria armeniaca TaxID=2518930 RepID=A0ABW8UYV0_9RHOB